MSAPATLRPIGPLAMPDVTPGGEANTLPVFTTADPRTLLVDESYQRNLSDRSVQLIRKIVAGWDWRAYKPPVVVQTGTGLHVLDGQHTAIAAATHPAIDVIPVMLVEAERHEDRASAFVKHNRDRIQVTAIQLHYALVQAGDEEALTVDQVCRRAGVRLLRLPPSQGRFAVGDTIAISSIQQLVRRRSAKSAREVLQVCAEGRMAPVSAAAIRAVDVLLHDAEYSGQILPADISLTIREIGLDLERRSKLFGAEHKVPVWRGMVATLFRNTRKARRGLRSVA